MMNKLGIFILNSDDSLIVVILVGVFTVLDFILAYGIKGERPFIKYFIMINDCLIVTALYSYLSMHTVLMLSVPVIKSALYFNRKFSLVAGISSSIAMFAAHILSVSLSIVPDDVIVKSYFAAIIFGFLPRFIQFVLINIAIAILTRNSSELFNKLDGYKKLEAALAKVESARKEILHNRSVTQALGDSYVTVFSVDIDKDEMRAEKLEKTTKIQGIDRVGVSEKPYSEIVAAFSENNVDEEDREKFDELFSAESIRDACRKNESSVLKIGCKMRGAHICSEISIVPMNSEEHPNSVVIGIRNISDQVAKEQEQLEKMEKMMNEAKRASSAKSNFLSRMSHDIRTPLNGIIGLFEIDEKHPDDIELWRENRKKATVAANHLLSLINDVLDMSKLEDGSIVIPNEPFDIFETTFETVTIVTMRAADAGINMEYLGGDIEIPVKYVYGSPLHLKQIFLNIYGNSIKYNKPGGFIKTKVEIKKITDTKVMFKCIVSDTGVGMSPEFLEHLFEPFSQEKNDARSFYQGTGLGMSIVKTLVEKMNGTIDVASEEGVGTTFAVSIPFEIADEASVRTPENAKEEADISGTKILIVEDNELNMEIAVSLLEDMGAAVTCAANGKEAVDIFNNNPKGTFDVILMDIMMPIMDGFTATRAIRALKREDAGLIPIIAMTANAFTEDVQHAKEAGMNAHLAKPIDVIKMTNVIAKYRNKNY